MSHPENQTAPDSFAPRASEGDPTSGGKTEVAGRLDARITRVPVDHFNDPLLLLTREGTIDAANKAYCRFFNCSAADLTGKPLNMVHGGLWNVPETRDRLSQLLKERDRQLSFVIRKHLGIPGVKTLLVRMQVLSEEHSDLRIIVMFTDVTLLNVKADQDRLLKDAERAARMTAEHANRSKDQFLAMLSHELRNPLNSVLGWTQLLRTRKSYDAGEVREALNHIESATRAQVRMISDLLDITRIAAGKIKLEMRDVDVSAAIESAVELFVPAATEKSVQIVRHLDPIRSTIKGDPERFQQILANLLSNALKFTPEGGRVEVTLRDLGSSVEIAVQDTGPGIPPEFRRHLFQRFRQADCIPSQKFSGGLGLGLAIVKNLVALHGGSIRADSLSTGARFVIDLPIAETPTGGIDKSPAPANDVDAMDESRLAGLSVLLVDDDPDACAITRRIFEEKKSKVFIALSAREGLDILKHRRPDVIVSDISMPDQDGYELMRQVRSLPPEQGGLTPAIALTAFARAEDRRQALAVGYQKHLAKPVDPIELLAAVASVTSAQRGPSES